jgi:hypothetical protein
VQFCENCGQPLEPLTEPGVACSSCRFVNRSGVSFCENCGEPLQSEMPPTLAAPRMKGKRVLVTLGVLGMLLAGGAAFAFFQGLLIFPDFPIAGTAAKTSPPIGGDDPSVSPTGPAVRAENPDVMPLADVLAELELTDPDRDPNVEGLEFVGSDGTRYVFEAGVFTALDSVPDPQGGGELLVQSRLGTVVGGFYGSGTFQFETGISEVSSTWAEAVLADHPGLVFSGDSWTVADELAAAAGLLQSIPGGTWLTGEDGAVLFEDAETRFLYVIEEDDHFWAWDPVDYQMTLVIADESGNGVVAGAIIEQAGGSLIFVPEESVPAAISARAGEIVTALQAEIPDAGLQALGQRPLQASIVPVGFVRPPIHLGFGSFVKKVAKKAKSGGKWVGKQAKKVYEGGKTFVKMEVDFGSRLAEVGWNHVTWPISYWLPSLGTEKDCGAPGPGPTGTSAPAQASHQEPFRGTKDQAKILEVAQVWLPLIKLSEDERCGEILRIVAKVFPYDASGSITENLDEAMRVEITYTIFFKEDGGRFFGTEAHPGDNEGMSVGLVRTSRDNGRCRATSNRFELVGAAAAAHKDADVWYKKPFTRRIVTKVDGFSFGGPCPPVNPSYEDDFLVWIAESKHAIYFDQMTCERELARFEECEDGRGAYFLNPWVELWDSIPEVVCPKDDKEQKPAVGPLPSGYFQHQDKYKAYYCLSRGEPRGTTKEGNYADYWVYGFFEAPIQLASYSLTVGVDGPGSVASSPAGIGCGSDCVEGYLDGTVVTLTASPSSGSTFLGWSGACTGSAATCTLKTVSDLSVTANFSEGFRANDDIFNPIGPGDIEGTNWSLDVTANDSNESGGLLEIVYVGCLEGCDYLDAWFADSGAQVAPQVRLTIGSDPGYGVRTVRLTYTLVDALGNVDDGVVDLTLDFTGESSAEPDPISIGVGSPTEPDIRELWDFCAGGGSGCEAPSFCPTNVSILMPTTSTVTARVTSGAVILGAELSWAGPLSGSVDMTYLGSNLWQAEVGDFPIWTLTGGGFVVLDLYVTARDAELRSETVYAGSVNLWDCAD